MTPDRQGAESYDTLAERLREAPLLADADLARRRFNEIFGSDDGSSLGVHGASVAALLHAIADHSPYLWRLISSDPARTRVLLATSPERSLDGCLDRLTGRMRASGATSAAAMRVLREAKQEVALLVALADLGGVWDLAAVTEALTRFADCAAAETVRFLLAEAQRAGKLVVVGDDATEACGLALLALGKQGARELNYSSDIDVVAFFDPNAPALHPDTVPSVFYVRLIQSFVRLMQEVTEHGYCLRVDLRLRPDPASTAVAIALPSAFTYYETLGQNWERAAFIKARPVAGDLALGARILDDLKPFKWRKYFDYAAIADIHAMKRQIHAVRGQADVAVAGHDVKLGRGGIREIEFFVQTQQLIFGGRRPHLRGAATLAMLAALAQDGWIAAAAVDDLSAAYRFLRTLEHRLQMIADQQTQRLPREEADLDRFARFAGFGDRATFSAAMLGHLRRVEAHYARLFEHAPGLDIETGSLVFTGTGHDPETVATLQTLGYLRPEQASETIRGWHFGRRPAVRTPRAREVLTALVPALLTALAGTGDPDGALATLDTMFGRTSSAVELLSLLRANAALRTLFADILGSAPRLADVIAARPHVLDAAIDPATVPGRGGRDALATRVRSLPVADGRLEDFLDRMRDLAQEELFSIGVSILSGAADPTTVGETYADLADLMIAAALERVLGDLARDHGTLPGGACVVLGMGKLGSRELTATSDLDLIVVYEAEGADSESNGPRPLDAARYYTRATQRLIAALTAPTRRGRLYDVDVRLRPSGRQGPLATRLTSFSAYQIGEAQAWEHMALTRARVVAGDPALGAKVDAVVQAVRSVPRDGFALSRDVSAMRALVAKEKPGSGFWDMKMVPGGLVDIEFAAQYCALAFGSLAPDIDGRDPTSILEQAARRGFVAQADAAVLIDAYHLQCGLGQVMRVVVDTPIDPARTGVGVIRRLCAAAQEPDLSALQDRLSTERQKVVMARDRVLTAGVQ